MRKSSFYDVQCRKTLVLFVAHFNVLERGPSLTCVFIRVRDSASNVVLYNSAVGTKYN